MRVFQIIDGSCWWDASSVLSSAADATEMFAPDMIFVDAPDYVREGWGYDEMAEGDARFLQPIPPEGYEYDSETGTFSPIQPPETVETMQAKIDRIRAMLEQAEAELAAMIGGGR